MDARPGKLADASVTYTRKCFEPLFASPHRLTRAYAASLVTEMKDLGRLARGAPSAEFFTMPSDMVMMNRLQFGFYSVLARLEVDADYARVEREFLPRVTDDAPARGANDGAARAADAATTADGWNLR